MAKTRSQTKLQTSLPQSARTNTLSQNLKQKKNKTSSLPAVRDCCIKLTRIYVNKIDWKRIDVNKIDLSKCDLGFPKKTQAFGQKKLDSKGYNLRKKATPKPLLNPKPVSKSMNQIIASSNTALYTSRAMRMWDTIKKQKNIEIKKNAIVCARMAGHRPWPAKVTDFKRNGVMLKFYGTEEVGLVKKSEIVPINLCQEMISEYLKIPTNNVSTKTLLYHMSFVKGIKEVSCLNFNL